MRWILPALALACGSSDDRPGPSDGSVTDTSPLSTAGTGCEDAVVGYVDGDGDGYGAGALLDLCEGTLALAEVGGDCDDADPAVHPGVVLNEDGVPGTSAGTPPSASPAPWSATLGALVRPGMVDLTTENHATVSLGPADEYMVTWHRGSGGNQDVLGQIWNLDGEPITEPFDLEPGLPAGGKPDVDATPLGYWTTWQSNGGDIMLRRWDLSGQPLGPSVVVYESDAEAEAPDVGVWPDGSSVVVWNVDGLPDQEGADYYRRYDADLNPIDPEPVVIEYTGRAIADVAITPNGGFVVSGTGKGASVETGSWVYAKLYEGGCEQMIRVDEDVTPLPSRPTVDVSPSGRVVVSWRNKVEEEVGDGAFGRTFDRLGRPEAPTTLLQALPNDGNRVVVSFVGEDALFGWQATTEGAAHDVNLALVGEDGSLRASLLLGEDDTVQHDRPATDARVEDDGTITAIVVWEDVFTDRTNLAAQVVRLAP